MLLLRDRREDLEQAGIRPFGISRDSVWSHRSWAEGLSLGDSVPLLSDWNGEATRAFGIPRERSGMADVPARSAFLIEDGVIREVWMLGPNVPDVDAVIAASRA
jgi:glutaredoxin-dependent peroxiredoxin